MIKIIPNDLRDLINKKLDEALKHIGKQGIEALPQKDRDILYHQLLDYFDEHGVVPGFTLEKKDGGREE